MAANQQLVLIVEAQIKKYREAFYRGLYQRLLADGIRLVVAYSDPPHSELCKNDSCDLPLEFGVKVKAYWGYREKLCYQPLLRQALRADLVILDEGNRYLLN